MIKGLFSSSSAKTGAAAPAAVSASAPAARAGAADVIKEGSDRTFMADVMEASRTVPVIVDFWATWCGPCKQMGPALEKAVKAARGAVRLVKIDVDRNPAIAGQLRIQSVPTVYAFFQGRPVDGFQGAVPESQIKQFVDRLIKTAGAGAGGGAMGDMLEAALAEAQAALDQGDPATASSIFSQILEADEENVVAYAGLVRCLLAAGDRKEARQMLDHAPAAMAKAPELVSVRATLELTEQSGDTGSVSDLRAAVARDPANLQARFDLALALFAADQREGAVDELLDIVRRDREWNEQAARKQLVKLFEAFGPKDPLTLSARRRLSSILFS